MAKEESGFWTTIGGVLILVLALLLMISVPEWERMTQQRAKRMEIEKLKQNFETDVAMAKLLTAEPCSYPFLRVILPPAGVDDIPRTILMGNDVSMVNSPLDAAYYRLRPNGNKVELWTSFVATQRTGEASRTWTKIGEKLLPDDPSCMVK